MSLVNSVQIAYYPESRSSCTPQTKIYHKVKGKAIPVTDRGGPQVCDTSRLPHFLANRLTDGGEVVCFTRRHHLYPQKDSWYSFLLEAETT
jgi:hypothetical protein